MKYLTIKSCKNLDNIAKVVDESNEPITKYILRKISEIEEFLPDEAFAGEYIVDVLDSIPINVKSFVNSILPKECFNDFQRLKFWGLDGGCKECGCKLEFWDWEYRDDTDGATGVIVRCPNKHEEVRPLDDM
jgi:hypothetical protein